jgi:hypothetical protein
MPFQAILLVLGIAPRSEVTACCWQQLKRKCRGDQHHYTSPAYCAFLYAGSADAEADATFWAGATNPESDVEAMAGELTCKCLHGGDS